MNPSQPLILTLQLDPDSFAFFNQLRQKHFPPAINYLDAHLTLFHHLRDEPPLMAVLERESARQGVMQLSVTKLMKLGRGVAYRVESKALIQLHKHLQEQWQKWLTPQDRQGLRPHITIQNKVAPATANSLLENLNASFQPFTIQGTGLSLWEYLGGPWKKRRDFAFGLSNEV